MIIVFVLTCLIWFYVCFANCKDISEENLANEFLIYVAEELFCSNMNISLSIGFASLMSWRHRIEPRTKKVW